MKSMIVIGAGITGVTTAYALAKRGYKVTIFDKNRYAAMETSFANGGQLSASNAEVWNHWSTVFKGLKWMLKGNAPLLINPKPSWHKISWFLEFMAAIPQYRNNTIQTARLAIAARDHLFAWASREGIEFDARQEGILHFYRDKGAYDHAATVSELLAKGGLKRRPVTPEEMQAIEPTLKGDYYGGFYTPSDSSGDIHKFTQGLADAGARCGVQNLFEHQIQTVKESGDGVRISGTCRQIAFDYSFDGLVVCAGIVSRSIAASLGDRLNVYPVKGYSITVNLLDLSSQAAAPTVSLLDDATKLVASRLGVDRFRVAGSAEFNGANNDIRADRIRPLLDWVHGCFPEINTRSVVPWAGLRPMMPNLMPRVGPGKSPRVFYNTGHGHLGWTLSAATAELVAGMVDQRARAVRTFVDIPVASKAKSPDMGGGRAKPDLVS